MGRKQISSQQRGFTTIELLVALVIIVIMSTVAIISMQPALKDAKIRAGCRIVASTLNYARSHAASTNTKTRVIFDQGNSVQVTEITSSSDDDSSHLSGDDNSDSSDEVITPLTTAAGKKKSLPDGILVTGIVKNASSDDSSSDDSDNNWIDFTGLGQTDRALIEISDDSGDKRYVTVDPITGRCQVRTAADESKYEAENSVQQNNREKQ